MFVFIVSKQRSEQPRTIGPSSVIVEACETLHGARTALYRFLVDRAREVEWATGETVCVLKTCRSTVALSQRQAVELPSQSLMFRVSGRGVQDGNVITDETTEMHIHNTAPDMPFLCNQSEIVSRVPTRHSCNEELVDRLEAMVDESRLRAEAVLADGHGTRSTECA